MTLAVAPSLYLSELLAGEIAITNHITKNMTNPGMATLEQSALSIEASGPATSLHLG